MAPSSRPKPAPPAAPSQCMTRPTRARTRDGRAGCADRTVMSDERSRAGPRYRKAPRRRTGTALPGRLPRRDSRCLLPVRLSELPARMQSVLMSPPRLIGYWTVDGMARSTVGRPLHEVLADAPGAHEAPPLRPKREGETAPPGEWRGAMWPDPRRFVDPTWNLRERRVVADYLERGTLVVQFRGLSRCRFCGQANGSAEMSDGVYRWPEGLAHGAPGYGPCAPRQRCVHHRGPR